VTSITSKLRLKSNAKLGDMYVTVLLRGLEGSKETYKLYLRDNNLRKEDVLNQLKLSTCNIQELDLSENQIGRYVGSLKKLIVAESSPLRKLWLDRVLLSDEGAHNLLDMVTGSKQLRCLSLSENKLTDRLGPALATLAAKNDKLEELYLCWNNFTSAAAEPFFRSLAKNESLRVLDLGWNSIGSNLKVIKRNATQCVEALCEFLRSNKSMLHFGLNNNDFSFEESKLIAEVVCLYTGYDCKQHYVRIPLFRQLWIC
jgi:NLR family CARD domain-containing protein 3